MGIVVKKFGGTSVGDIPRIKRVAELLYRYTQSNPQDSLVVVVSAMAGETNRLLALSRSCVSEPNVRELDVLAATGEQVTVALLAMAMQELGLNARSVLGHQAVVRTDCRHTAAHIEEIEGSYLKDLISHGAIPVVAGFQGETRAGDITTLGRGGSDISAVAVAAALGASACYIYTDVDGVYSTDPRICPSARRLSTISHQEMLELASLGAKVLHPRSVYFAMRYAVPLVVLSTFVPGAGTWIVKEEEIMEKPVVTGITYRADEALLSVHRLEGGIKSLNRIFSALADAGIFVDVISQTLTGERLCDLSFTIADEASSQAFEIVQQLVPELGAEGASIDRNIAKVSIVGIGIRYHSGVSAQMFESLAREGIDPHLISSSDIKISVIIPRKYCELAVRSLHETFVDMRPAQTEERALR